MIKNSKSKINKCMSMIAIISILLSVLIPNLSFHGAAGTIGSDGFFDDFSDAARFSQDWTNVNNTGSVTGGKLSVTQTGGAGDFLHNAVRLNGADSSTQYVSIDLEAGQLDTSSISSWEFLIQAGLLACLNGTSAYALRVEGRTDDSTLRLLLLKIDNGSSTSLKFTEFPGKYNHTQRYRLSLSVTEDENGDTAVTGNILNLATNELHTASAVDETPLAGGTAGVFSGRLNLLPNPTPVLYDNFYYSPEGHRFGDLPSGTDGDFEDDFTLPSLGGHWNNDNSAGSIAGGKLSVTQTGSVGDILHNAVRLNGANGNTQYVSIDLEAGQLDTSSISSWEFLIRAGLLARLNGTNAYALRVEGRTDDSTLRLTLLKIDDGQLTSLQFVEFPGKYNHTQRYRLSLSVTEDENGHAAITGNIMNLATDDFYTASAVDETPLPGGTVGVFSSRMNLLPNPTPVLYDDFYYSSSGYREGDTSAAAGKKMLYVNTAEPGSLMQLMEVTPGKTYTFSFGLSDSVADFSIIGKLNGDRQAFDPSAALLSKVKHDGFYTVTYSITVPATSTDGVPMTNVAFIGVEFPMGSAGYIFDITAYRADDAGQTELLGNPDFQVGLDSWAWGWSAWFGVWSAKGATEWNSAAAQLAIVDYDEELFQSAASDKKMLYVRTSEVGTLMYPVTVTPGKTYTFSFGLSNSITDFSIIGKLNGDRQSFDTSAALLSKTEHDGFYIVTYSFTVPATSTDGVPMTDVAFIGIEFPIGTVGYLFDLTVYRADDAEKTELLGNPDFQAGLDGWAWGWSAWFGIWSAAGDTEWSSAATQLKIVDYDEELLKSVSPVTNKYMLYFKNSANPSGFTQRIYAEPGMTYHFTYSMFSTKTDETTVAVWTDGDRQPIVNSTRLISKQEHGNYVTQTHSFTIPADFSANPAELIFVGLYIPYHSEGFVFDISLCKANDPDKREIFPNPAFKAGLDYWAWGWSAWFGVWDEAVGLTEWTGGNNELKVQEFDLSEIDRLIALLNVDDGEWWSPKDIVEAPKGIATVKGTLTDQNGKNLANIKLVLVSSQNTYRGTTNAKGLFEFRDIAAGFYDLYAVNQKGEQVATGYFVNLSDGDTATVNLVCAADNGDVEENTSDNGTTENDTGAAEAVGTLKGTVYTPQLETVSNLTICIRNVGQVTTDTNGYFEFSNIPAGEYELYTLLSDNTEYVFRNVLINENAELEVKLKYDTGERADTPVDTEKDGGFGWVWIAVLCGGVLLVAGGVTFILIRRKKTVKK